MSVRKWQIVTLGVALLMSFAAGCERGERADEVEAKVDKSAKQAYLEQPALQAPPGEQNSESASGEDNEPYHYSPFVVKIDSEHFDTVSFKDVGLGREAPAPHDPLLETISHAFLYEVGSHSDLQYDGEVVYDERILDPSNHLYCGERHLYIDVWKAEGPDRWGYSMWSGCGEMDNFAWKEVEIQGVDDDSLTAEVAPLAESLASRLAEANRENCFTKTC